MKFQIDTIAKTIKTEKVNLGELVEYLQVILPDSWKEYDIVCDTQYITIPYTQPALPYTPQQPGTPWIQPEINPWKDRIVCCWSDQKMMLPHVFNYEFCEKNPSQKEY